METIVDNGDAADALLINQLLTVASGGDFWESGGQLSTAGSSTAIELSVSSVTVNIGGQTVTHGSQPVTHSATSGEYRTDVVYADSAGVSVQEGVEMTKVPQGNQFASVWQPAPDNGSLIQGVPLWCVHVTPDDSASTDIESWQMQDRRMNAENINTDAIVSLLEDYDTAAKGSVQTHVENSDRFNGYSHNQQSFFTSPQTQHMTIEGNSEQYINFYVPDGVRLRLWALGVVPGADGVGTADITLRKQKSDGSWANVGDNRTSSELNFNAGLKPDATPLRRSPSNGQLFRYRVRNTDNLKRNITAQYIHSFAFLDDDTGYSGGGN